jgi:hypothetical protein
MEGVALGSKDGDMIEAVIATGGPSLTGLTGSIVCRSSAAHAVSPWAVCYTYHGIGTAGLGIRKGDVAGR